MFYGLPPLNSWGNGSARRVIAIGFAFDIVDEVMYEAKRSAEVKHGRKLSSIEFKDMLSLTKAEGSRESSSAFRIAKPVCHRTMKRLPFSVDSTGPNAMSLVDWANCLKRSHEMLADSANGSSPSLQSAEQLTVLPALDT